MPHSPQSALSSKPPTVLLIEDEPGDARLIEFGLLERDHAAFSVITAQSLAQASEMFDQGLEPDVVLLDLNLPDTTGTDTVKRCRALADAPIVVITGLDELAASRLALSAGVDDYLSKDCTGSELRRAIRYTLIRHKRDADSRLARAIFAHAREAIMITDTNGRISNVNEAFSNLTGYSRDEAIGKSPEILQPPVKAEDTDDAQDDYLSSEPTWLEIIAVGYGQSEVYCLRRDGTRFVAMQTTSPVLDCRGNMTHQVTLFSDITLQKLHAQHLERIAHFDILTGLPNRSLFADRLQQAMANSRRHGAQLGVAFIDLDGFKAVNDKHGHHVGDALLTSAAENMRKTLRETDTLARFGGDEFAVVLSGLTSEHETAHLMHRLLRAISTPCLIDGHRLQVSASIGLARYPQQEGIEAEQLIRQADQAMYQAKNTGKNRFYFFDANMDWKNPSDTEIEVGEKFA